MMVQMEAAERKKVVLLPKAEVGLGVARRKVILVLPWQSRLGLESLQEVCSGVSLAMVPWMEHQVAEVVTGVGVSE